MNYWLVKSEPDTYSFQKLQKERSAMWDGVRNFTARNNLKKMKRGDLVFFYHSNIGLEIVGIAKVAKESYPDPTAKGGPWLAVDLEPVEPLERPVTLAEIKKHPILKNMVLAKTSRLSVMPVEPDEFERVKAMGNPSRQKKK